MHSSKSLPDLFLVVVLASAVTAVGAVLGINERLLARDVVADMAVFLLLLSCGLVWYTWRRLGERKIELEMLQNMEEELLAAKNESEQASRMKDEFLANVSHELRTPLNGVMGMVNLLRLSDLADEQREYCDLAMESAEQQLSVIDDLIDFSRIETGRLMLTRRQFDPVRLAESVVDSFRGQAGDKGLELVFELPDRVPSAVMGDDGRLRQILFNLVENGIKYTETGEIRVVLSADCAGVDGSGQCLFTLRVSDTGIGIPEEMQGVIFDKFTKVDGSLTRLHGGSGLGLTIVKSLAELMHGQVALESEVGVGSVFTVAVPLEVTRESFSHEEVLEGARAKPMLTGYRVLVVEEERAGRASLSRLMEQQGQVVAMARSGREALTMLERDRFDCVLMDVLMPGRDGVETARHIRRGKSETIDPSIPIIAITSLSHEDDRQRCFEAGMDACLPKPADPEAVMEEMLRLLTRRAMAEG